MMKMCLILTLPLLPMNQLRALKTKLVFEGISLRELLSHSSGITNGYLVWRNAVSGQYEHQQLIEILENQTGSLDNNKAFKYDNLGYNIFALILQEEFGLNWKNLLKEKIFQPLEMERTSASYDHVITGKMGSNSTIHLLSVTLQNL